MQVASETEYNTNISGALNIVNYAKGNMSAFTLNSDKKYTASAAIDSLNSDISNLTSILNISSFNAENLTVYKKTETVAGKNYSYVLLDLTGKTTDNTDICITFSFDTAVSQFWLRKDFEQLTNFSIIGGPSTTDVDYSEIYFTNNGFRINYPNRTNKTQRDVYYERDTQTSDYFVYRQDESGIWSKSTITQIEYENVYNLTYGLYLGNILNNSSCLKYAKASHSQNSKANYSENKAIAYENAQGTWWYYDVNFVFGGANFENASWKMKMTQGEASTAVYSMQLNTQNVTITFPQIAE